MVDVIVVFSHSAYFPGEIIHAKITLRNSNKSTQIVSHYTGNNTPVFLHAKKNSYSGPGDSKRYPDRQTSQQRQRAALQKDQLPSYQIPTARQAGVSEHKKSRSVTFGSLNLSSKTFQESHPAVQDESARPQVYHLLLNVHAQVVARFTIDPALLRADKFDLVRGVGDITSGGIVSNSSLNSTSRWSLLNLSNAIKHLTTASPAQRAEAPLSAHTYPIMSVMPSILDVQIALYPGEEKTLEYNCKLPTDLPPSYTGSALWTTYSLKLAAQQTDHTITTFECPVHIHARSSSCYDFGKTPVLASTPSLPIQLRTKDNIDRRKNYQELGRKDFISHLEQLNTTNKQALHPRPEIEFPAGSLNVNSGVHFDISRGPGEHVCTLTLSKRRHVAGEVVTGVLNFAQAQLDCAQFKVSLEESELVGLPYCYTATEDGHLIHRKILNNVQVPSAFSVLSKFALPITPQTTGSFRTIPLVLQYHLLFEYSISDRSQYSIETRTKHGIEFAAGSVDGLSFECRIPIEVEPDLRFGESVHEGIL